jgi:DivIVA domain-containing protein
MALDRQSIERRDFPIGRRGYEPEAVDAHLARLAEEIEELRRRQDAAPATSAAPAKASPASMAQAASEQVRAIVEAAETSAAGIQRAAEEDGARIRSEAEADARQTRDDAVAQSQAHVGQVRKATAQMLQRVDAMESELSALVESLRTGANRLTADLSLLEGNMGDLYDAAGRDRATASPAVVESVPAVVAPPEPPPALEADEDDDEERELDQSPYDEEEFGAPESAPASESGVTSGDVEGARLVALNMALNGTSREETDRYLAENFDLADRVTLLDEVYATVES